MSSAGDDEVRPSGDESKADASAEALDDAWARYVLGLDAAFHSLQSEVAALAPADLDADSLGTIEHQPRAAGGRRLATRTPGTSLDQPDLALEGAAAARTGPVIPASIDRRRDWRHAIRADAGRGAERPSELVTAAVGSAVAVRLLINASPPRPPRTDRKRRMGSMVAPWPELIPPTSPHA